MKTKSDILGYDFQGWPIYKMNLREILNNLGFKLENDKLVIDANNPILDVYPITLEDDGMAYGVNDKFISEVSVDEDSINIFIDKKYETQEN